MRKPHKYITHAFAMAFTESHRRCTIDTYSRRLESVRSGIFPPFSPNGRVCEGTYNCLSTLSQPRHFVASQIVFSLRVALPIGGRFRSAFPRRPNALCCSVPFWRCSERRMSPFSHSFVVCGLSNAVANGETVHFSAAECESGSSQHRVRTKSIIFL